MSWRCRRMRKRRNWTISRSVPGQTGSARRHEAGRSKRIRIEWRAFRAAKLTRAERKDVLYLAAPASVSTASFLPEQNLVARVALKDGRVLDLQTTVQPARPRVSLVSKSIQLGPNPSAIRLANQELLPQDGKISFL